MSNSFHLRKVKHTRDRWDEVCARAFESYVQAVRTAKEAGHTHQEIADAAGLKTRSAVAYLLNGDPRKDQT